MSDETRGASPHEETSTGAGGESAHGVSIERLAERVYQLMLREVRLERARGSSTGRGGR